MRRLRESAVFWRDCYITACLHPNATVVHLEDHAPGNADGSSIVRYRPNKIMGYTRDPASRSALLLRWIVARIKSLWNALLVLFGIRHRTFRILLLGEVGSGRSSLLSALKGEPFRHDYPLTLYTKTHSIVLHGSKPTIQVVFYEMSDQETARRIVQDYFQMAHGVLYVIDAADTEAFPLCKRELSGLIADKDLEGKPIVVLGNKIDNFSACSEDELRHHLGLASFDENDKHNNQSRLELFMCSVKRSVGYVAGLNWLHCWLINKMRWYQ